MGKPLTFSKEERLCSKILIDKLFTEGKSVYSPPFKFVFVPVQNFDGYYPVKVVFSVSKRIFKQAVKRNLIRRRMREAYRINKLNFYESVGLSGQKLAIMIIFTGKEITDFSTIEAGIIKGMNKILVKIKPV